MVQVVVDPALQRPLDVGEVGRHAGSVEPVGLDCKEHSSVVAVKLAALSFVTGEPVAVAKQNKVTMALYASLVQNIAQSAVYDALMEFKSTGTWTKSAKGQRLGNTIPAEFRARMLRQADHTDRATKYKVNP